MAVSQIDFGTYSSPGSSGPQLVTSQTGSGHAVYVAELDMTLHPGTSTFRLRALNTDNVPIYQADFSAVPTPKMVTVGPFIFEDAAITITIDQTAGTDSGIVFPFALYRVS